MEWIGNGFYVLSDLSETLVFNIKCNSCSFYSYNPFIVNFAIKYILSILGIIRTLYFFKSILFYTCE